MNIKSQARLYLIMILSGAAIFGAAINRQLLEHGLRSMPVRNIFVVSLSYIALIAFIKIWPFFLESSPDTIDDAAAIAELVREKKPIPKKEKSSKWGRALDFLPGDLAEFTVVLLGFFLLYWVAQWIFVEGPMMLIDEVLDVALSIGLISASREILADDRHNGVLKRTIVPFIIVLTVTTLVLCDIQIHCPVESRLSEVVHQCW